MAEGAVTPWSGLSYIPGVAEGSLSGLPEFVPDIDVQRLAAYRVLAMYMNSCRRDALEDETEKDRLREYGDPGAFTDAISAAVLGEEPALIIDGADTSVPRRPNLPPAPEEPDPGLPALEAEMQALMFQAAAEAWKARATAIIERWVVTLDQAPVLEARQDWLQEWASPRSENVIGKLTELESELTVPLGDGLMIFGWDPEARRPSVEVMEPDAYFPVKTEVGTRVKKAHLAWLLIGQGETVDGLERDVEYVRRITYELVPVDPAHPDFEPGVDLGQAPKYLVEGQEWHWSCLLSNAIWKLEDFKEVLNVEESPFQWQMVMDPGGSDQLVPADRIPIGLDFMPIIHFTHTPAEVTGWGRSPLTRLAQLFDQLFRADTGQALSSAWAAEPLTVLKGLVPGTYEDDETGETGVPLAPGRGLAAEGSGGVETVPMAENLDKIGAYVERLLDRISALIAVPKGLMGRIEAADIASGITLVLLFTRFEQSTTQAREARRPKWPLIVDYAQKIEIQNAEQPFGEGVNDLNVYPGTVQPGKFMPNDTLSAANIVKLLRDAGAISQEAALRLMEDNGMALDDLAIELARLREVDGATALEISEAVGARWASRYLGLRAWAPEHMTETQPVTEAPDPGDDAESGEEGDSQREE